MLPKSIRLKILNWLGAGKLHIIEDSETECNAIASREDTSASIEGLSFTVMPAQGGTIVQMRQWDKKNHESTYSTHVITQGDDVAENIGKIVAIELWKV